MRLFARLTAVCILIASARLAYGHGHPIRLTVENDRLVVSQGVSDSIGFATQIFVEEDSAGDPEDFDDFSGFGPAIYWTVPGLDIFGLAQNSGLYLEALARPVQDSNPPEQRLLWYWDSATEEIKVAPSGSRMQIRKSSSVNIPLTPTTITAPPPIKIAAPLASEMGFHNHDLIRYLLPVPLPQEGAYAFFARLTSDLYAPSDPFLVVINNGAEYEQMMPAALAINAAAVLAGDFNRNGTVDAADYTTWRNGLGANYTPADYNIWKNNFGRTGGLGSGTGSLAVSHEMIPEPAGLGLAASSLLGLLARVVSRPKRCFDND